MSYKDKYVNLSSSYGLSLRDKVIESTKYSLESSFRDSPIYFDAYMTNPLMSEKLEIGLHLIDKSDVNEEKTVLALFDTPLVTGSLISLGSEVWLAIHADSYSEVYKKGIIRKCVSSLVWQDDLGEVLEAKFCRRNDSVSNFGLDDGNIITLPNERRQISVQANSCTSQLKKTQRFIFDGRVWRIIGVDRLIDGIINLALEESMIDPATDNLELRIANYNPVAYSVQIHNGDSISVHLSQPLQLNIEASRNDIIADYSEIILSSSNPQVGEVNKNGLFNPKSVGSTVVTATYGTTSSCITIIVRDIQYNNLSAEIIGDEFIYYGKSTSYKAIFKNNGFEIDESSRFTLKSLKSEETLANIISQDEHSCIIVAGTKSGQVELSVVSNNGLITTTKNIFIKSYL